MGVYPSDSRDPDRASATSDLVARARRGETAAWAKLYDDHAKALYRRILMPRLGDPMAAEDALSETFRTAIENFDQFEDQGHGLFPWLSRIAHNKAMDLHRKRKTRERKLTDLFLLLGPLSGPLAGADDLLEFHANQQTLEQRVSACLTQITPRYRQAIELRFFQERSREDCAQLLEVKLGTFDVLLLRALRSFGKAWSETPEADS